MTHSASTLKAHLLRVMSFNIRGAVYDDGVNRWVNRAGLNVATIRRYAPDLIGFQEFQDGNLQVYREHLPGYECVLGPQTGNGEPYNYNAILWDPSRLELMDSGGFWLSSRPDTYSGDWQTDNIRAANWARLRCKEAGTDFLHVNTHLDNISALARVEGSKLIVRRLVELGVDETPVIVTGDFNANPWIPGGETFALASYTNTTYRTYIDDAFTDAYLAAGNEDSETSYTYHAFEGAGYQPERHHMWWRVDWILARRGAAVRSCSIIHDAEPPLYPSDHYPVLAELELSPE